VSSYLTVSPLPAPPKGPLAVCFLLRSPSAFAAWTLSSALLCGVRTFLDRRPRPLNEESATRTDRGHLACTGKDTTVGLGSDSLAQLARGRLVEEPGDGAVDRGDRLGGYRLDRAQALDDLGHHAGLGGAAHHEHHAPGGI
jgi:hypothetical protein